MTLHVSLSVRGALGMSREEKRRFMGGVRVDGRPVRTIEELDKAMRQLLEEGTECLQMSDECQTHDPKLGCQCMKKPGHSPVTLTIMDESAPFGEREKEALDRMMAERT